jgi:phage baseplate assembly protein V
MNPSEKSLFRKITNLFARGIVKLVNDNFATQTLQASLLADESRDNIENAQPYGFTYHPLSGAECIALFFGGNRDHGSVITVFDKRYRPKNLKSGEVCLYDASGTKILLNNKGEIEITTAKSVKITAPTSQVMGNLEVKGNITATGDITDHSASVPKTMAGMRASYNAHTHPDPHGGHTGQTNNPM